MEGGGSKSRMFMYIYRSGVYQLPWCFKLIQPKLFFLTKPHQYKHVFLFCFLS